MALSGEFSSYPVSGFGLYCTWSASQNKTENYSNVTLNVYLKHYSLYVGQRTDSTISINNVSETYTSPEISESNRDAHKTLLKTKKVKVNHNADGTKNEVELSASWNFSGTYSGTTIGKITASTKVDLDIIDRTAPTVTFTYSDVTSGGFKIIANSSATANLWEYSTDNGSTWTSFSTAADTSASVTITNLSPNTTFKVLVRARKQSNGVYGTSSYSSIKTLGGAVLNSVSTVTADNSTVTISLNATVYNSSYSNKLVIKDGSTSILTITGISWSSGTSNRTITLNSTQRSTILNAMTNQKSFTATFELSSFNGTRQIGSISTQNGTIQTTAANSAPTFTNYTYRDGFETTSGVTQNNQYFIQDYSKLYVTPEIATAKNGASIMSYSCKCGSLSVTSTTANEMFVGTVTESKNIDLIVTVTDSRGYTKSVTKTIDVIPYTKLKLNNVSLRRTNGIESEMQLTFDGSFSSVKIDGSEKNQLTNVKCQYKKTNEDEFVNYIDITRRVNTNGVNFTFTGLELVNLDAEYSYDFKLDISDALGSLSSQSYDFVVTQGTPLISLKRRNVGINTPNPAASLHVVGDVKINDDTIQDFVTEEGSDGDWEYRKWSNGKAECWCKLSLSDVPVTSAWGSLYTSGSIISSAVTFPFEFAEVPFVTYSSDAGGFASLLMRGGGCSPVSTKSTGTVEAVRGTSMTINLNLNYYVIGKWK